MLEYEDEVVVEEQKKETFSITFFDTSLNEINLDNFLRFNKKKTICW